MTKTKLLEKGQKFGRLTVIELDHVEHTKRSKNKTYNREYYKCACECGNEVVVSKEGLKYRYTQSCGCLKLETSIKNLKNKNNHGLSNTKLYKIYADIKSRCFNSKKISYKNYGGRGITMCEEWLEFENFYNWAINNGYKEGLTIERIDVNGNYEEKNCKWIPLEEQAKNRRDTHFVTYNGKTYCVTEWATIVGLKRSTLEARINNYGWNIEKALTTPVKKRGDK